MLEVILGQILGKQKKYCLLINSFLFVRKTAAFKILGIETQGAVRKCERA